MRGTRRGRWIAFAVGAVLVVTGVWLLTNRDRPSTTFTSVGYESFPKTCPLHGVKTESETVPNHGFVTASYGVDIFAAKAEKFPLDTINDGYGHPNREYKWIRRSSKVT